MSDTQRHKTLLLFGAPGVGKGTQGKMLGSIPGFYHLSSGDIFRALDANSELGRIFHDFSSRGELVPDDVTIAICTAYISKLTTENGYDSGASFLILDGIPRNVNQAAADGGARRRAQDCPSRVRRLGNAHRAAARARHQRKPNRRRAGVSYPKAMGSLPRRDIAAA